MQKERCIPQRARLVRGFGGRSLNLSRRRGFNRGGGDWRESIPSAAVPEWKATRYSPLRGACAAFISEEEGQGVGGKDKNKKNPSLRGRLFHISRAAIDLAPQKRRQCRTNQICQSCVFQETSGTVNDYTARHGERELGSDLELLGGPRPSCCARRRRHSR